MSETNREMAARLARLLDEEMRPRGLFFVLLTTELVDGVIDVGCLSSVSPEYAINALEVQLRQLREMFPEGEQVIGHA